MPASLERIRILIVDDNHHMVNIVKTLLRGFGMKHYYEAKDAAEAFDIVRDESIDIIVVDFLMDLLDGTDFTRLVRTADDSPNKFVPIIMLTAYSERSRVEAARDAGVTEFCCKPVTAKELWRKVQSIIDYPRDFVRTPNYFGPDRRRRSDGRYNGPERRKDRQSGPSASEKALNDAQNDWDDIDDAAAPTTEPTPDTGADNSQDDIDKIMAG
ncbi:MAG: response regulator [Maricaulaceae bacterium]